ncbi:DgyrCDS14643 [Dimorphilus gyrociliatus]|uniref:DgyrCDS14643 n=1 Tax=Dimorphilus gyrociliatus TaxID=2664684 RepID=A0A7I8WEB5_9ANNE|nr:DgyrCDS14643 [Dimorphilus gyrociliatus]
MDSCLNTDEKLCLNYNKTEIEKLLNTKSVFDRVCIKLTTLQLLYPDDKDILQKQYDGEQKSLAVQYILNKLWQLNFVDIWEIFFDIEDLNCQRLAECLSEKKKIWEKLICDTKIERKKEFTTIPLLPFTKTEVKISDIITSIKISEVQKIDIIDWELQKTEYEYEHFYRIFCSEFKKILIQGKPGIGKSVHVKYLLHKWANDQWKIDSQKLLLFIILREVKKDSNIYQEIIEQNFKNIPYITENIVESIFVEKRNDVVLLIDGADELYQTNHPLYDLLESPICDIPTAIWSREWRAKELLSKCDIIFDLTGWNTTQMRSFFQKCFKDGDIQKSLEFVESLVHKNKKIESLCKVPLLAMILFHVWKKRGESIFDRTLYQNYEDIISFPQENHSCITKENDKNFQTFYELCLENLSQSKIILDDKNLSNFIEIHYKNIIEIIHLPTNQVELQFYHLSFQEFFAAKCLIGKAKDILIGRINDIFNCFLPRRNNINSLFEELTHINLFNVMEFVQHHSTDIFKKILLHSEIVRDMFNFSNNLKKLLENGFENDKMMKLENETLNDAIINIIFIKYGKNLENIILINTSVNLKLLIDCCFEHCTRLKFLEVKGQKLYNNNEAFKEDLFLENLLNLKFFKELEKIQIGENFLDVKGNTISGQFFDNFCKFIIIYSSNYIIEFTDEAFNSKNYFTDAKIKLFEGLFQLKKLVIANKNFGETGRKRFFSMIEKKLQNTQFKEFETYNCEISNLDWVGCERTWVRTYPGANVPWAGANVPWAGANVPRKCTETHNIPICKPCNKRKCTVMLKKLTNLEIHQFKVNSEESFIDERNKIAAVEESILEDENHVLSECQSMDLDSLEEVEENAEEYCESSTKSDFEIVKGGSRKGHDILLNDGYSFVVKHKTPSSTIWVCSVRSKKKRCVARIRQNGNLFLKGNLEHNHNRKKNLEVDIKVKTDLKIVCRSDNQTSGRSIAEKVLLSYEPNATCLPDINYLKRMANSNRQKFRPVEPKVYNFNLDETFLPDEFLQKDICENGERILIFATNHQLNLLSKSNCWYIDGTFKIVKEPFYQLVTIHSFVKKSGDMKQVPLVFIFLTSKHTKAYLQAFQHINNLINDFHPKRITMDFEKGLWKALSKVYPLTEFQGCVFHFTQAVYRKIQALGYVKKYKEKGNDWKDFRKLMALPFLPAHIIQPTFDRINAELCEKNRFLDLLQYFQTNWIKNKLWKPNNWSVFGLSIRTNNDCEGWHQRMNSKLPAKGRERTWVRSHPPRVRSHPGTFTPSQMFSTLQLLNLTHIKISNEIDFSQFINSIKLLPCLTDINFEKLQNTKEYLQTTLNHLNCKSITLSHLNFDSCNLTPIEAKILSQFLKPIKHLKTLNLSNNKLMKDKFQTICLGLKSSFKSFEGINIQNCNLNHTHMDSFEKLVLPSSNLVYINLSGNPNIQKSVSTIFEELHHSSKTLKKIEVNNCSLTIEEGHSLGKLLKKCLYITHIGLAWNKNLGESFGKILEGLESSSDVLKNINLGSCSLNEKKGKSLGKMFKKCSSLTEIKLGANKNIDESFQEVFKGLDSSSKTLEKIDFNYCSLNKEYGKSLAELLKNCSHIKCIDLKGNKNLGKSFNFVSEGLASSSETLQKILLEMCNLNVEQGLFLAKLFTKCFLIKGVNIAKNNNIRKSFTEIFEGLESSSKTLEYVNVGWCKLNEEQGKSLGKLLKKCSNLKNIDLSGNKIMGKSMNEIFQGLESSSKTLEYVNVGWCKLNEEQGKSLGKLLKVCSNLKNIDLSYITVLGKSMNEIFQGLESSSKTLEYVNVECCKLNEEQGKSLEKLLKTCSNLKKIDLSGNKVMGKSVNEIFEGLESSSNTLENINVGWCELNEEQGKSLGKLLKKCSNLKNIDLSYNNAMSKSMNEIFEGLESSSNTLEYVNVQFCELNEEQGKSLGKLLKVCSTLKNIDLSGNKVMGKSMNEIFEGLESSSNTLENVNVGWCELNEEQGKSLGKLLKKCSNLKNIDLSGNKVMGKSMNEIFEGLESSSNTLEYVNVLFCKLNEEQGKSLGKLHKTCSNLKKIDLSGINVMGKSMNEIFEGLESSSNTLENVNVRLCELNEGQGKSLGKLLKKCSNLKKIDLSGINVMGKSMNEIFEGLESSSNTLEHVNVRCCELNEEQGKSLGKLHKTCSNLKNIDLSGNKVMGKSMNEIFEGLESSSNTLENVNVGWCELNEEQLKSLGKLLKKCSNLKKIDLSGINVMGKSMNEIFEGLESSSKTLEYVYVDWRKLNEEQGKSLGKLLKVQARYIKEANTVTPYGLNEDHGCYSTTIVPLVVYHPSPWYKLNRILKDHWSALNDDSPLKVIRPIIALKPGRSLGSLIIKGRTEGPPQEDNTNTLNLVECWPSPWWHIKQSSINHITNSLL